MRRCILVSLRGALDHGVFCCTAFPHAADLLFPGCLAAVRPSFWPNPETSCEADPLFEGATSRTAAPSLFLRRSLFVSRASQPTSRAPSGSCLLPRRSLPPAGGRVDPERGSSATVVPRKADSLRFLTFAAVRPLSRRDSEASRQADFLSNTGRWRTATALQDLLRPACLGQPRGGADSFSLPGPYS